VWLLQLNVFNSVNVTAIYNREKYSVTVTSKFYSVRSSVTVTAKSFVQGDCDS